MTNMAMTDLPIARVARPGACTRRRAGAAASRLAFWLGLAAAPTFGVMALWSALGSGPPDLLCTALQGAPPAGGMTTMYLLMGAFHAPAWLRLLAGKG